MNAIQRNGDATDAKGAGPAWMNLSRFEFSSDGVFAIAITLLIIEIKPPDLSGDSPAQTIEKLLHLWPHILGYITSFLVIGVIWINHHALFNFLPRVDRTSLILNLLLLLCVAFVPLPTALLGSYGDSWPVVMFYGLTLALTGAAYNALWFYSLRQFKRGGGSIEPRTLRAANLWTLGYPLCYFLASLLSIWSVKASIVLYALVPLFYLLPSTIDRQLLGVQQPNQPPNEQTNQQQSN